MGYKYEVYRWNKDLTNTYKYYKVYEGNNIFLAIWIMIKTKLKGYGCVKLEWR